MTYRERLRYHLNKAEEWQAVVTAMEKEAMQKAAAFQGGRMSRKDQSTLPDEFMASRLLDTFRYKSACSSRNAHQAQIQMYGMAILAGLDG